MLPNVDEAKLLRMMRIVTLVFAVIVTIYALNSESSIFSMAEIAYQVTLVTAFVPLVCGVYWKRATNQGALFAIVFGLVTWLAIMLFGADEPFVPAHLAGLIASIVGMVVGSLLPQKIMSDIPEEELIVS